MIPPGRPLRVIGDVHGDAKAFGIAAATEHFIIQLGDLVDEGPDTPGALEIMFRLLDEHRGLFILGNHDFKLLRALRGDPVSRPAYLERTLCELEPALAQRAMREIAQAPAWIAAGDRFFVHGGFHPAMLRQPPPPFPDGRPDSLLARAIYGQTSGHVTGAGKPERLLHWVNDIPGDLTPAPAKADISPGSISQRLEAYCRNGLLRRSAPKLEPMPWPQIKPKSSPRGRSFSVMDVISAWWSP
jgi:protein phosphatase